MYKMILTEGGSIGDIYVNTLRTDEHGAIYVHPSDQVVVTQPDEFVKAGNSAPGITSVGETHSVTKGFHWDSCSRHVSVV